MILEPSLYKDSIFQISDLTMVRNLWRNKLKIVLIVLFAVMYAQALAIKTLNNSSKKSLPQHVKHTYNYYNEGNFWCLPYNTSLQRPMCPELFACPLPIRDSVPEIPGILPKVLHKSCYKWAMNLIIKHLSDTILWFPGCELQFVVH